MKKHIGWFLLVMSLTGCSIVSCNRTFPKVTWYWSADAVECRKERAAEKLFEQQVKDGQMVK